MMRGRARVASSCIVAGLLFAVTGIVLINQDDAAARTTGNIFWLLGGPLAMVGFALWIGYALMASRRARDEQQLFQTGTRTTATVESVETTRIVLNVNARIVLHLRVQPRWEPEFAYQRTMVVPLAGMPQTGDVIDVAYDPGDKSKVALPTHLRRPRRPGEAGDLPASREAAAALGTSYQPDAVIEKLERLHRLRQDGALTEAEFEAQKAKVIAEQDR